MAKSGKNEGAKATWEYERDHVDEYASLKKLIEIITTWARNEGVKKSDGTSIVGADLEIEVGHVPVHLYFRLLIRATTGTQIGDQVIHYNRPKAFQFTDVRLLCV